MTRRLVVAALLAATTLAGCSDSAPAPPSTGGGGGGDVDQVPGQVVHADSAALSPDGSRLVAGCRDELCVWDTSDGSLAATYDEGGNVVAWSPDGDLIATDGFSDDGTRATIELLDAGDGTVVRTLDGHDAGEADDAVGAGITDLAFSADGASLVSAGHDGAVRLWSVSDGAETANLETAGQDPDEVALSPDGARVVIASPDEPVEVWDISAGRQVATLDAEPQGDVAWSPDGDTIATASRAADPAATVGLWDAESLVEADEFPGGAQAYRLAFSPDGSTLAFSQKDDDAVVLWALGSDESGDLAGHQDQPRAVLWSPGGDLVYSLSSSEGPLSWDASTGELLPAFEVPED